MAAPAAANFAQAAKAAVAAVPTAVQAAAAQTVAKAAAGAIEELRYNQPWTYYSTLVVEDWTKQDTHILSFWQDTRGTKGLARTNLAQPGQIPEAFKAYGISIRIACSFYDNPRYFELITNWSAIELKVGSDEMIDGPLTQFPAGGGVHGALEVGAVQIPISTTTAVSGGSDATAPAGGGGPQAPTVVVADMALITPGGAAPSADGGGIWPGAVQRPLSILTNGVPHRSNIYQFAHDPIRVKKGSNISTDLIIDRGAFAELKGLSAKDKPLAPGIMIQLSLEGRRARSAGYGTGG